MEKLTIRKEIRMTESQNVELREQSHKRKLSQGEIIREALILLFEQWKFFDDTGQGTE